MLNLLFVFTCLRVLFKLVLRNRNSVIVKYHNSQYNISFFLKGTKMNILAYRRSKKISLIRPKKYLNQRNMDKR